MFRFSTNISTNVRDYTCRSFYFLSFFVLYKNCQTNNCLLGNYCVRSETTNNPIHMSSSKWNFIQNMYRSGVFAFVACTMLIRFQALNILIHSPSRAHYTLTHTRTHDDIDHSIKCSETNQLPSLQLYISNYLRSISLWVLAVLCGLVLQDFSIYTITLLNLQKGGNYSKHYGNLFILVMFGF